MTSVGSHCAIPVGPAATTVGTSRHEFCGPDSESFGFGSPYAGPGAMLDRWVTLLDKLSPHGGTVLLPYNFADQCTGWLRATSRDGVVVEVQAGWSNLGQYSFDPADFELVGASLKDFAPIQNARVEGRMSDIVGALKSSRDTCIDSTFAAG